MSQDALGRCDFIDVLEEAAVRKTPVGVRLRSGEVFIDVVDDVVTEGGADYAVFRERGRQPVAGLLACTRAGARAAPTH